MGVSALIRIFGAALLCLLLCFRSDAQAQNTNDGGDLNWPEVPEISGPPPDGTWMRSRRGRVLRSWPGTDVPPGVTPPPAPNASVASPSPQSRPAAERQPTAERQPSPSRVKKRRYRSRASKPIPSLPERNLGFEGISHSETAETVSPGEPEEDTDTAASVNEPLSDASENDAEAAVVTSEPKPIVPEAGDIADFAEADTAIDTETEAADVEGEAASSSSETADAVSPDEPANNADTATNEAALNASKNDA